MGKVYLADHPRLPRQDALKILRTDVSADEDYCQRFIKEADLAARLWHPNIVRGATRSLNTKPRPHSSKPVYNHGNCSINHRTPEAASKCRNG